MLISNLSNNPIKSVLDESVEVLDVLLPIGSPLSIVTTAGTTPVADNLGDDDFGGVLLELLVDTELSKLLFNNIFSMKGGGFAVVGCGLSLDVELLLLVVLVLFVDVVGVDFDILKLN